MISVKEQILGDFFSDPSKIRSPMFTNGLPANMTEFILIKYHKCTTRLQNKDGERERERERERQLVGKYG